MRSARSGVELPPLSPLGTARQRLASGGGSTAPGASQRAGYPVELLSALRDADLGEESLFLAWQLAAWAEGLSPAERHALTAVIVRALISVAEGSTRLPVDAATRALLARAPEVVGAPGDRRPFIVENGHLYQQRLLACEDRLAALLRARLAGGALIAAAAAERALGLTIDSARPRPTDEQAAAVRAALRGRLTVVSGGPGTGKTTIVLAIVRALGRLGLPVEALALAAPTGKAANRLAESIKQGLARMGALEAVDRRLAEALPEAQTIHRLLAYSPRSGTFHHHQNNRLAQKVVIVDESSMIDLSLMERLARAVADDARLILLGDADQLASVEAGAVFRDLTPLALRLTRSHRVDPEADAGRRLLQLAAAIRDGSGGAPPARPSSSLPSGAPPALSPTSSPPPTPPALSRSSLSSSPMAALITERPSAAALRFEAVELLPPAGREALLDRWHAERVAWSPETESLVRAPFRLHEGAFDADDQARLERLQQQVQSVRILCVTHGRPTGTLAVNQSLHRRHGGGRQPPFALGEPVMMLHNDYERGLFNGDQGVVIRLREDGLQSPGRAARLAAAFPTRSGWAAWPLDSFGDALELSFAMTVHKAQGSEHDVVALLLPETPIPLLTRELLYTAITRARRAVVICGSPDVLAAAAAATTERSSGLQAKVSGP
jgi:exodeoxyribonuclease V alpha subunit